METEKSSLHRIIKKLKGQVEELKERLEKVSNHNTMQTSTEMAKLHNDLDKQKIEIADLKSDDLMKIFNLVVKKQI